MSLDKKLSLRSSWSFGFLGDFLGETLFERLDFLDLTVMRGDSKSVLDRSLSEVDI
jgi:hypothetical protein